MRQGPGRSWAGRSGGRCVALLPLVEVNVGKEKSHYAGWSSSMRRTSSHPHPNPIAAPGWVTAAGPFPPPASSPPSPLLTLGSRPSLIRLYSQLNPPHPLQVIAATNRLLIASCHECAFNIGTPRPPVLIGDNRFLRLAPYNTRWVGSAGVNRREEAQPVGRWLLRRPGVRCWKLVFPRSPRGCVRSWAFLRVEWAEWVCK
jgi:hypothetical protein